MANGLLVASSGTKQAPTAPVCQLLMLTRRKAASATVTKSYSLVFFTHGLPGRTQADGEMEQTGWILHMKT